MNAFFPVLLGMALAAVVASLFAGLFFMARGGSGDPQRSNRAMRFRVALQGLALLLFIVALLVRG